MVSSLRLFFFLLGTCVWGQFITLYANDVSVADLEKFQGQAAGRICLFDSTEKNPRVWVYYPGQKTEWLKCSSHLSGMVVISDRMLGYEWGKAVKNDKKFITPGFNEFGQKHLYYGRDALIGRALQLGMGLTESYTDPFDSHKKGLAIIPEYNENFIFNFRVKSGDILKLKRYFDTHEVQPQEHRPLLLLDIIDDAQLTKLDGQERAFLDAYFTWDVVYSNVVAQRFLEQVKTKMREFERDVEAIGPIYKDNMRESVLRMLEAICSDFEFKRFAPKLALVILGLMILKHREVLFKGLRVVTPFDKILDFLGIDLGEDEKESDEAVLLHKLLGSFNTIKTALVQYLLLSQQANGLSQQAASDLLRTLQQ